MVLKLPQDNMPTGENHKFLNRTDSNIVDDTDNCLLIWNSRRSVKNEVLFSCYVEPLGGRRCFVPSKTLLFVLSILPSDSAAAVSNPKEAQLKKLYKSVIDVHTFSEFSSGKKHQISKFLMKILFLRNRDNEKKIVDF